MSAQAPYVDASRTDDAASFVSTLVPPSFLSADTESIAPLLNSSQNGPHSTDNTAAPRLVTPSAATSRVDGDDDDDKIIMTSIPVTTTSASKSLLNRFKPKSKMKIVLMPQSEYKKYFAKDKAGIYTGTEPQREWTETELDERYAKYKSSLPRAPMRDESAPKDGGGIGVTGGWGMS